MNSNRTPSVSSVSMMRAILMKRPGGPEVLEIGTCPAPTPGKDELLVGVKATALNGADLLQRKGLYPPPPGASEILGLEIAGEVLEMGTSVQGWKRGQRVMALLAGGGYAEKVVVPAALCIPVPDALSDIEAAAIPEVFTTAFLELILLGALRRGESVLIHAGGSGVGSAAIQIAREVGARVFTTAGSDEKLQRCRKLGADVLINSKKESFSERVQKETQGQGVNVILDLVGASYWNSNIASLSIEGRLLLVGLPSGAKTEINLRDLLSKRITVIGSTLRARPLSEKIELTRKLIEFALPRLKSGKLVPIVDRVFDWKDVAQAHAYLESKANFGKVVLEVKSESP